MIKNKIKKCFSAILISVLCVSLASCVAPEKTNQPQPDNAEAHVTDVNSNSTNEQKKEEIKTPSPTLLEGEWILGSGMIEGEEYTAEDAGYTTEITFKKVNDILLAHYWRDLNGLKQEFETEVLITEEPVYEGCGNDEWSAIFMVDGEFPDKDEFSMTLIDEDKLLLKHVYIIDHNDDSMGMSYSFYDRK